jgi:2-polyprenyl-6-methoxyphenol hydroxylase-like FAD-dependent oxidoreductase
MAEHGVLVVGAGPTGLMLAGELALGGADVAVVERRTDRNVVGSRAGGMTPRTIEVPDQRGIAYRFLDAGTIGQNGHYAGLFFDVSDLPTRHKYGLALLQYRVETILADWVTELGVPIHYGLQVTGIAHDDSGVDATVSDGTTLRAAYLAGYDGGRSVIRKAAGIAFPGWAGPWPTRSPARPADPDPPSDPPTTPAQTPPSALVDQSPSRIVNENQPPDLPRRDRQASTEPAIRRHPRNTVTLSHAARFTILFLQHTTDNDRPLNPQQLTAL